ncbi:hypothetical protein [Flavobacterium helocola]|uniref:KTSC domain-containing protein n=1 Tax=Flavobacterium helocola TaxID=3139139 RepID=A0ABU9I6L8_9FLAO
MKKIIIMFMFLLSFLNSYSQEISCNELLNFIVKKGYNKGTISSYTLNSSWLSKVTAYEFDYKTYVVAEIKRNEYSYQTETYIFCGIPNLNWSNFRFGGYGDSESYGERFHKYIIDYKCNCY